MFHHFHGKDFPRGQGSISAQQLADLIDYVGRERFLPPEEWQARAVAGRLSTGDLCLTFDDGLACQAAVAAPVLENLGLRGFWFISSAPLEGKVQRLEVYRYYRDAYFENVNDFYREFDARLQKHSIWPKVRECLEGFSASRYLADFSFYTNADRRFRFIRDEVLGPNCYFDVMDSMIRDAGLNLLDLTRRLHITDAVLRKLHETGHRLGLHSHSHPTKIDALSRAEQREEYQLNQTHLEKVVGGPVRVMSHPCNDYSSTTLAVLEEMGIEVGFRSNMRILHHGRLEYPREDHTKLIGEMAR